MKVADLQQHLSNLALLVQAADGKKSAVELTKIADGLQVFRDFDLNQFLGFLARAEEYSRTGLLPVVEPKSKPTSKPRSPARSNVDIALIQKEVEDLYRNAGSPHVTIDAIDGLRPRLNPLAKGDLLKIAQAVELSGMSSKTKPVIAEAVVARIRSIKQSAMRSTLIDRPGSHS